MTMSFHLEVEGLTNSSNFVQKYVVGIMIPSKIMFLDLGSSIETRCRILNFPVVFCCAHISVLRNITICVMFPIR